MHLLPYALEILEQDSLPQGTVLQSKYVEFFFAIKEEYEENTSKFKTSSYLLRREQRLFQHRTAKDLNGNSSPGAGLLGNLSPTKPKCLTRADGLVFVFNCTWLSVCPFDGVKVSLHVVRHEKSVKNELRGSMKQAARVKSLTAH
jgi:hypothetical protein